MRFGNFTPVSDSAPDSGVFCVRTVSTVAASPFSSGKVVRIAGLEPARVAPLPPQSSVSANSTICAQGWDNEPAVSPNRKGKLILWPVASPLECSVTREFGNQGFFAFGEGSGCGGLADGAFV